MGGPGASGGDGEDPGPGPDVDDDVSRTDVVMDEVEEAGGPEVWRSSDVPNATGKCDPEVFVRTTVEDFLNRPPR